MFDDVEKKKRAMERSGMTRRYRLDIRQSFGEAIADDVGHLGHEILHFLPFSGEQVLLQLRVDRPLGFDLCPFSADEHAEQLHVPGWVAGCHRKDCYSVVLMEGRHAPWEDSVDRYLQHTVSTLVLYIGGGASRGTPLSCVHVRGASCLRTWSIASWIWPLLRPALVRRWRDPFR